MNHDWSEPDRYRFKTELVCQRCGIIKVRHHQADERGWP